jgi:hypothetical protein
MLLNHPSVLVFGFAINVMVMGCGIMEHLGPCITRIKIHLQQWLPTRNTVATNQPKQSVRRADNDRKEAQTPPNPPPTSQPNVCGPPKNFTPGQ